MPAKSPQTKKVSKVTNILALVKDAKTEGARSNFKQVN